jgi:hypothetical protein
MKIKTVKFLISVVLIAVPVLLCAKEDLIKYKPGAKDGAYKPLAATEKVYVIINRFLEVPYEEIGQVKLTCSKALVEQIMSAEGNQQYREIKEYKPTSSSYSDDTLYFILEYLKSYAREKGGNILVLKETNFINAFDFLLFIRTFSIGNIDAANLKVEDYYGRITDQDKEKFGKKLADMNKIYKGKNEAPLNDDADVEVVLNRFTKNQYTELGTITINTPPSPSAMIYDEYLSMNLKTLVEFAKQKGANYIQLKKMKFEQIPIGNMTYWSRDYIIGKK